MSDLPMAVWSGEIMGLKVHVLDDGRRIIDADSARQLLSDIAWGRNENFDADKFAVAIAEFIKGEGVPTSGTAQVTENTGEK